MDFSVKKPPNPSCAQNLCNCVPIPAFTLPNLAIKAFYVVIIFFKGLGAYFWALKACS